MSRDIFALTYSIDRAYKARLMKLLSTPQVAERLGVTVARVQALIWAGRLPAQKVGRDYVIQEADLRLVKDRKPGRPQSADTGKKIATRKSARNRR